MFRTEFKISTLNNKIDHRSGLFFLGSCFSENIADRMYALKFNTLSNPFGIIYNPVSIASELRRHLNGKWVNNNDVFISGGIYRSFDFHSLKSHPEKESAIRLMNDAIRTGKIFLEKTTHLIITFGTAMVYRIKDLKAVVANNHKLPVENFIKEQLNQKKIIDEWTELILEIKNRIPGIQIIFTVSPIRHIREGIVENSRSKAILIDSIHELIQKLPDIYYFPSYELMLDDLRDYRFYEKDMIHPNEVAIEYICEKFINACFDPQCYETMNQVMFINNAMKHKPFFPETEEHQLFLKNTLAKILQVKKENPALDFEKEINYFSGIK